MESTPRSLAVESDPNLEKTNWNVNIGLFEKVGGNSMKLKFKNQSIQTDAANTIAAKCRKHLATLTRCVFPM